MSKTPAARAGARAPMAKDELLSELRGMLRDVFAAQAAGQVQARVARAHGYVDGFMRALLDSGVAGKHELLELVAAERQHVSGPALRTMSEVDDQDALSATAAA
jgi:hypothetical protein